MESRDKVTQAVSYLGHPGFSEGRISWVEDSLFGFLTSSR